MAVIPRKESPRFGGIIVRQWSQELVAVLTLLVRLLVRAWQLRGRADLRGRLRLGLGGLGEEWHLSRLSHAG